jgi:hypothetical protein
MLELLEKIFKNTVAWGMVVHTYNPNYVEGTSRRIMV